MASALDRKLRDLYVARLIFFAPVLASFCDGKVSVKEAAFITFEQILCFL